MEQKFRGTPKSKDYMGKKKFSPLHDYRRNTNLGRKTNQDYMRNKNP
jgi:hypothetical protein